MKIMRRQIETGIFLMVFMLFTGSVLKAQSVEDGKAFIYYERYKSAKDILQKALAANPANEEATYCMGKAEIGLEEVKAAKTLYLAKLAAAPNSPLVLAGLGYIVLIEGRMQDVRHRS